MIKKDSNCVSRRGPHAATHPEWAYRREAIVWFGNIPLKPNFVPYGRDMCHWLQKKSNHISLFTKASSELTCELSNPYSYSLTAISVAVASAINDAGSFSESEDEMDPVEAEVARIRLEAELVILVSRFCEAAIKQMLYATQIPPELYKRATMGQLLARDCQACKKTGSARHDISLLGALAHRFFLCPILDKCAIDHLGMVARRRNLEAAHSDSQMLNPRTAKESKADLARALEVLGNDLGHMADHISEIELKMVKETDLFIKYYPKRPPLEELFRIPIRNPDQYHPEILTNRTT